MPLAVLVLVFLGGAALLQQGARDVGGPPPSSAPSQREGVLSDGRSPTPSAAPTPLVHVVEPGDTLIDLARTFYGDESAWPRIHEANREQLVDPDALVPGQRLVIPSPTAPPDS